MTFKNKLLFISILFYPLMGQAENTITKKFFIQNSGVKAMCSNTKYLKCLGMKPEKCHSDINSCLEIIPSRFKVSKSEPIMKKFNTCLLSKNDFSDKKYDKCDVILDN